MVEIGTANGKPRKIDESEYIDRLTLLRQAKSGDLVAIQALSDRYHLRIGGVVPSGTRGVTTRDTVQQEATMGSEMATCDVCGKEVRKRGLGVHKARAHKGNGKSDHIAPAIKPAIPQLQRTAAHSNGNGCESCCFRGLDRHIDQDLVRRAVVAGMALDAACAFVREVKSVFVGGVAQ